MRCYFWEKGELRDGVLVSETDTGRRGVFLGEHLKEKTDEWVFLYHTNPPKLYGKYVNRAYPVLVDESPPENTFALADPHAKHDNDSRILVKVSTRSDDLDPVSYGFWDSFEGQVETLKSGVRTDGKGGTWREGLIRMYPTDVLRIRSAGKWGDDYVVFFEGEDVVTDRWERFLLETVA